MAYDYTDDIAFAESVISEFGDVYIFERMDSVIDTDNPLVANAGNPVVFSIPGVGLEVIGSSFGRYVDLTDLIKNHDKSILTPGYQLDDIETFHTVTEPGGKIWKIGQVMTFAPADVPVLHFVGLKR